MIHNPRVPAYSLCHYRATYSLAAPTSSHTSFTLALCPFHCALQVKLWSMRDFSLLKTMEGHEGRVMCGDVSDDGKYFATAAMDRTWKLWG